MVSQYQVPSKVIYGYGGKKVVQFDKSLDKHAHDEPPDDKIEDPHPGGCHNNDMISEIKDNLSAAIGNKF